MALLSTLEDLDFADDLALLSHTHQHMFAQQVGLKISQKKTEVMMLNVSNPSPVKVNGEDLQTTEKFTYLGSTVRHDGGAGSDIRNRLNRARNAFRILNNEWKIIPVRHRDQAKTILLRMLEDDCKRPQPTVHLPHQEPSKNPTNILAQDHLQPTSFRPLRPRQHEHHHHAKAMEMDRACGETRARQHCRTALHWTTEGKRKRRRPKNTWHGTVEGELKTLHHTWGTVQKLAQNRQGWSTFVAALHASRHNRHE